LKDRRIVAGSTNGIVVLDPNTIDIESDPPPPVITDISLYGRKISPDSLLQQKTALAISYKENYFFV
jgi:hypothetical protein